MPPVSDPVAKRKNGAKNSAGGPEPEKAEVTTTKVRVELIKKAKMVALHRDIDLFVYLDGLLTGPVDRDYAAFLREEKAEP